MSTVDPYDKIARRLGGRLISRWPLKGGVSADVQALEIAQPGGSVRVVVRRHGAADWKPLEGGVTENEHALMTALAAAGFPVPRPLLMDVSGRLLPSPWLALPFVDGTTEPRDLPLSLRRMADFLSRLHALDPSALTLPAAFPRRDCALPELLEYLPERFADLRSALAAEAPTPPARTAALHGDFWPGNVLWRGDAIAAVLDWEDAALGDPLADLAGCRVELLWKYGPDAMEIFTARYLRARAASTDGPVDARRLALWELLCAAGGLAFMDRWGLAPEVEAQMRARAHGVLDRAAGVVSGT